MLNVIVSTETFIFSDLTYWLIDSLTHWLMTHDSLTHLTHKTSVLTWRKQLRRVKLVNKVLVTQILFFRPWGLTVSHSHINSKKCLTHEGASNQPMPLILILLRILLLLRICVACDGLCDWEMRFASPTHKRWPLLANESSVAQRSEHPIWNTEGRGFESHLGLRFFSVSSYGWFFTSPFISFIILISVA